MESLAASALLPHSRQAPPACAKVGRSSKNRPTPGQHFPGTVSLRATTFMDVLEDVLKLKRTGFRNIALYNWHFENAGFVYEPAYLVSEQKPELKIVVI